MNLKLEDFKKYRDTFGLNQLTIQDDGVVSVSDNGSLFTLEYLFLLDEEELNSEIERIKKTFQSLEIKTEHGVVSIRFPTDNRTDSMDNATALLVFSVLFDDSRFAKLLHSHGELIKPTGLDYVQDQERSLRYYPIAWLLNGFKTPNRFYNVRPNLWSIQSWWGRSPGFVALIELTATGKTSILKNLALLIGQFIPLSQSKTSTSDKKLTYLVWQYLKSKNRFWKLAYNLWTFLLLKVHPNGMKDIYEIYYGKTHPINKYSVKFKE